ncbi:hypothetical protein BC936DRAFT_140854 [Jimgerdemannia flammicorona]|uniref:Uncharacterized protein n=1 Tax=Jimgerdemannia flammicorona TaxID=994334 RepID=A0A433DGI1_9FUNG|nr:hypothetical protein BC936DRAFT_140854 [Jimgerdemannia flammicorona]
MWSCDVIPTDTASHRISLVIQATAPFLFQTIIHAEPSEPYRQKTKASRGEFAWRGTTKSPHSTVCSFLHASDDQEDVLLAKLKAHGDMFMSALGVRDADAKKKNKKRKVEDVGAGNRPAKNWVDDDDDPNVGMKEGDDGVVSSNKKAQHQPEIVVFDGSSLKKPVAGNSKVEYKAFMSSKVSKLEPPPPPPPKSVKEMEEEEKNLQNDRELQELLKTSKLLEEYQVEEMSGKERRKFTEQKLVALGVKASKGLKVPTIISLGMQQKRKEREAKELEEAKHLGLYHHTQKHLYPTGSASAKPDGGKFRRDRGLGMGIGKFKEGVLTLSKQDIARVEGTVPSRGGRGGRRGGRGCGRGGGKGGGRGGRGGGWRWASERH